MKRITLSEHVGPGISQAVPAAGRCHSPMLPKGVCPSEPGPPRVLPRGCSTVSSAFLRRRLTREEAGYKTLGTEGRKAEM